MGQIHQNDLALIEKALKENKLFQYRPYDWQQDFHNAGLTSPERMLMAANRVGKTEAGASEVALHLTGRYPDWWQGKRFNKGIRAWCGSPTNLTSRDIQQRALLGGTGSLVGQGAIPKRFIIGKPKTKQAGVSDVVDYVKVRHISGDESQCVFKTYDQGWRTWQGEEPEVVWMDEEPTKGGAPNDDDHRIFTEAQTRILTSHGILLVTFTPLYGVTLLVEHFQKGLPGTYLKGATWDQAPHLSKANMEELKARYPAHEVETRTMGVPMMGAGRVFPVSESEITCEPFEIPAHFARICGIDFGMDHPAAGAWLAHDRDTDILYLYDCYRKSDETVTYHAEAINRRGKWIPVSWPHDGMNREKQGGQELHRLYRQHGVNMLSMSARYDKDKGGGQPVEPIVMELVERMKSGTFKVFSHLHEFFEEFRFYHRKDGKIVPIKDDIMKAVMYAAMMKRYATPNFRQRPQAQPAAIHVHL